ncbi:arylamine N-acetyltransferase family protein [Pleurotus pulmonarius]|nr:N-terminal acetyltransferase [Pleurotus pulmonarius]
MSAGLLTGGAWIKKSPGPYSAEQVVHWLSRIGYDHSHTAEDIRSGAFQTTLENLGALSRRHLQAFPFENVAMHYEKDHFVDVSPRGLYQRLVVDGKGSYCFGLNGLLLGMIRGLGYRAYGGAARVNMARDPLDPIDFQGLTHMVMFVQPGDSNQTWVVDVGFGGSGLARPMLLSDAEENVVLGTTPSERHRLVRKVLPMSSLELRDGSPSDHPQLEWQLHVSHTGGAEPWRVLYTFTDREFFDCDYQAASFDICTRPYLGLFWDMVWAVKYFTLDGAEAEEVETQVETSGQISVHWPEHLGRLILSGKEAKKVVGTRNEIIATIETDGDRIRVLREFFGLSVVDEDAVHIKGRRAALG